MSHKLKYRAYRQALRSKVNTDIDVSPSTFDHHRSYLKCRSIIDVFFNLLVDQEIIMGYDSESFGYDLDDRLRLPHGLTIDDMVEDFLERRYSKGNDDNLILAIKKGYWTVAEGYIDAMAINNIGKVNPDGTTILHKISRENLQPSYGLYKDSVDTVKLLADNMTTEAFCSVTDVQLNTALHAAVLANNYIVVEALVQSKNCTKVFIDFANQDGHTALNISRRMNYLECVSLLENK